MNQSERQIAVNAFHFRFPETRIVGTSGSVSYYAVSVWRGSRRRWLTRFDFSSTANCTA